jgi:hypothetical protein
MSADKFFDLYEHALSSPVAARRISREFPVRAFIIRGAEIFWLREIEPVTRDVVLRICDPDAVTAVREQLSESLTAPHDDVAIEAFVAVLSAGHSGRRDHLSPASQRMTALTIRMRDSGTSPIAMAEAVNRSMQTRKFFPSTAELLEDIVAAEFELRELLDRVTMIDGIVRRSVHLVDALRGSTNPHDALLAAGFRADGDRVGSYRWPTTFTRLLAPPVVPLAIEGPR